MEDTSGRAEKGELRMGTAEGDWHGVRTCCYSIFGFERLWDRNAVDYKVGHRKVGWHPNGRHQKQEQMGIAGSQDGHCDGPLQIPKVHRDRYLRTRKAETTAGDGRGSRQRHDADDL